MVNRFECFNGNQRLKAAGVKIPYTKEQVKEIVKCSSDPIYFIKKYVKILNVDEGIVDFKLYPFQEKYVKTMHENRFVIVKFPRQSGKALSLETKIPTPFGYKTMGDIQVGDVIYGSDGKETNVTMATEVMFNHNCYEITFDNGEKVVADEEHLWEISCSDWEDKPKIFNTKEVIEIFSKKNKNGQGLYIFSSKELEGREEVLPIQPYTLGLWLGDGETKGSRITTHILDFPELSHNVEMDGYSIQTNKTKKNTIVLYNIIGLRTLLKSSGLFGNKHIPQIYKRSSVEQRLQLIRGLMDSDGTCCKNGSCEFYQKKRVVVDDFREILSSLGIKSRIRETEIDGQIYYTVSFTTEKRVFNLNRKYIRQANSKLHPKNTRIYFSEFRSIESVPVRCIQVDNDNHMFLFGETMVPTHNSITTIAYFLWYIIFNNDVKVAILANKAETAQELMQRLQFAYESLPFWIQQGITTFNKRTIELENKSKVRAAATSSASIRGDSMNILLLDEFAHIDPPKLAEEFFTSTYPTISSGKTTKIFMVSTPKGMNLFYKMWTEAINNRSSFVPVEVNWRDVPGRDSKWEQETINNIGPEKFDQEYECSFLGSVGTLISSTKLKCLTFKDPEKSLHGLDVFDPPEPNHSYILAIDTAQGKGLDYHAIQVIDVTQLPYKQVAKFRNHHTPVIVLPNIIEAIGKLYNNAHVLIEVMDTGAQVADMLHFDLEYENLIHVTIRGRQGQTVGGGYTKTYQRGLKMTPQARRQGCMNLKALVEHDKLIIQDFDTIKELTTFTSNNKNGKYEAEEGAHDDLVMSLVVFSWLVAQKYFREGVDPSTDLRLSLEQENRNWIDDELTPARLVIDDGLTINTEVDSEGTIWTPV